MFSDAWTVTLFVCQKCVLIALFLLHLAAHLFEHDLSKHTHSSSVAQLITHIYWHQFVSHLTGGVSAWMLEKLDFDHSPQCTNTALAGVRGATVVACKVRLGGRVHSWDRWKCFDVSVPCRPECSWTAVLYCLNQSLHIHQTSSVTSALQVCFSQKCAFSNMFVFIIFAWCDASMQLSLN